MAKKAKNTGTTIVAGISDPGLPGRGDARLKKMSTAGTSTMKVASATAITEANRTP
jgi:hypothetical protein